MGMYNELNNISRAVNGQALELKKTQQQQKQAEYIKSELKSMLQNELMDLDNIFDDEAKATAIESVVNNTIILLYSKDYTRQFLNDKYYTIARQVEQIKKKTAPQNQNDYKKRIAVEKWNIQRERERVKLAIEREKLQQLQQKQVQKLYKVKQAAEDQELQNILSAEAERRAQKESKKEIILNIFFAIMLIVLFPFMVIISASKHYK